MDARDHILCLAVGMVSVDKTDSGGRIPLYCAALYGHKSTITLLRRTLGVDIAGRDNDGATPLYVATRENHRSITRQILAEESTGINASCQSKTTALHFAVEDGNMPLACVLVHLDSLGPNLCDDDVWTASSYALCKGDLRILDLNASNVSPIYLTAEWGHLGIIWRLLSFEKVNINQTVWHKSPLFIAIDNGFRNVADLLLQQGGRLDFNAKPLLGDTAFAVAVSYRYLEIVELLLEDDCLDIIANNRLGKSALLKAASMGHEQVVRCLCRDTRIRNAGSLNGAFEAESNPRIR
ncbi:uncharacterized protein N7482_009316 [Penicillium canariense]|uniref:Uncharacterized protein n=1 Tax=Penicillium canariense TaxID=189055 RepID=A0A9W9HME4_9EURO|nr:uncharacterized protein N7482_009316 [Penicillium canariense]KAJ5152838.1 hypothetical protein N7482_009316 [Penicillium canariense]